MKFVDDDDDSNMHSQVMFPCSVVLTTGGTMQKKRQENRIQVTSSMLTELPLLYIQT